MTTFLYRCPALGYTVQGFVDDDAGLQSDTVYSTVTCTLCRRVHLVNAVTGRVAGAEAKPSKPAY